jgi:hypothetical protein
VAGWGWMIVRRCQPACVRLWHDLNRITPNSDHPLSSHGLAWCTQAF